MGQPCFVNINRSRLPEHGVVQAIPEVRDPRSGKPHIICISLPLQLLPKSGVLKNYENWMGGFGFKEKSTWMQLDWDIFPRSLWPWTVMTAGSSTPSLRQGGLVSTSPIVTLVIAFQVAEFDTDVMQQTMCISLCDVLKCIKPTKGKSSISVCLIVEL